jgi:hypothetical protein
MANTNYYCCDERRHNAVKDHPLLNGIEFLEVVDNPTDPFEVRQTVLIVHFIKDLVPGNLTKENIKIEGGERIRNIEIIEIGIGFLSSPPSSPPSDDPNRLLVIKVKEAGDFSRYTLRLVKDKKDSDPPTNFDPVLSAIDFSFKVLCENDFDCKPECECALNQLCNPRSITWQKIMPASGN